MIFHSQAPESVAAIAHAARNLSSAKGIKKARWRLFYRLQEQNWRLTVNEAGQDAQSGVYLRPNVAQVSIYEPESISIELSKINPTHRNIERLRTAQGIKVLILIWNKHYRPWGDKRGEFHKVSFGELLDLDYIISAGHKHATISTPQSLFELMTAEQIFEQLIDQMISKQLEARILELVREGWEARRPYSLRRDTQERYIVAKLAGEGYDTQLIKNAARELLNAQRMKHSKHPFSWIRGLRTTHKMAVRSCPKISPYNPLG